MNVTVENCKHQALQHGANVFEMSGVNKTNCLVYRCHPDYMNFTDSSTHTDLYFVGRHFCIKLK